MHASERRLRLIQPAALKITGDGVVSPGQHRGQSSTISVMGAQMARHYELSASI
jgi:hypothetical protein